MDPILISTSCGEDNSMKGVSENVKSKTSRSESQPGYWLRSLPRPPCIGTSGSTTPTHSPPLSQKDIEDIAKEIEAEEAAADALEELESNEKLVGKSIWPLDVERGWEREPERAQARSSQTMIQSASENYASSGSNEDSDSDGSQDFNLPPLQRSDLGRWVDVPSMNMMRYLVNMQSKAVQKGWLRLFPHWRPYVDCLGGMLVVSVAFG
jgi:hypothetical protein